MVMKTSWHWPGHVLLLIEEIKGKEEQKSLITDFEKKQVDAWAYTDLGLALWTVNSCKLPATDAVSGLAALATCRRPPNSTATAMHMITAACLIP